MIGEGLKLRLSKNVTNHSRKRWWSEYESQSLLPNSKFEGSRTNCKEIQFVSSQVCSHTIGIVHWNGWIKLFTGIAHQNSSEQFTLCESVGYSKIQKIKIPSELQPIQNSIREGSMGSATSARLPACRHQCTGVHNVNFKMRTGPLLDDWSANSTMKFNYEVHTTNSEASSTHSEKTQRTRN